VRKIDSLMQPGTSAVDPKLLLDRLKELERHVTSVSVPLPYAGELYHLRLHIGFLQERLEQILQADQRGKALERTADDRLES
jgi:hypothetical protein